VDHHHRHERQGRDGGDVETGIVDCLAGSWTGAAALVAQPSLHSLTCRPEKNILVPDGSIRARVLAIRVCVDGKVMRLRSPELPLNRCTAHDRSFPAPAPCSNCLIRARERHVGERLESCRGRILRPPALPRLHSPVVDRPRHLRVEPGQTHRRRACRVSRQVCGRPVKASLISVSQDPVASCCVDHLSAAVI